MSSKVSLTPLQWIAIGGAVGIVILGGVGLFLLAGKVSDAQAALEQQSSEYKGLVGRRTFPSPENIEVLKANNQALKQAMAVAEKRLRAEDSALPKIEEQDPIDFKQAIADQLDKLKADAAKNGVRIEAPAADFGFSAYRSGRPSGRPATKILGKQLFAVQQVATALINAHVGAIAAVRRTMDEDNPGTPSTQGQSGPEFLRAAIAPSQDRLYTAYPLEVEFIGTEASLRDALAALSQNSAIFVPRFLTISSLRTSAPVLAQLETDSLQ